MSDDEGPSQISPDVPGRIVEFHSGNSQGQVTGDAMQVQKILSTVMYICALAIWGFKFILGVFLAKSF